MCWLCLVGFSSGRSRFSLNLGHSITHLVNEGESDDYYSDICEDVIENRGGDRVCGSNAEWLQRNDERKLDVTDITWAGR